MTGIGSDFFFFIFRQNKNNGTKVVGYDDGEKCVKNAGLSISQMRVGRYLLFASSKQSRILIEGRRNVKDNQIQREGSKEVFVRIYEGRDQRDIRDL